MARDMPENNNSLPRKANRSRVHLKVKLLLQVKSFLDPRRPPNACQSYLHSRKFQGPRVETQLMETLNDTLYEAWQPAKKYFHEFYIFTTLKVLNIYVKIGFSQKNLSGRLVACFFSFFLSLFLSFVRSFFLLNLDSFNFLFYECLVTLSS